MSQFTFQKAVKQQEKLRLALDGPAGSGKTWTSMTIATLLAEKDGGRIAVIDSERGSAKKYASDFDFDHLALPDSNPHTYIGAIEAAIEQGYSVIIVDSLSHAWEGTLELKDEVAKRSHNDSFGAWREVTPIHNQLVDVMLRAPAHVIATMRTKTEYLVEKNEATGKNKVTKIGLTPIQRGGVEFEFDVVGDMDQENTLTVSKSRCFALAGQVIRKPGVKVAETLWNWLNDGVPTAPRAEINQIRAKVAALPEELRTAVARDFKAKFGPPDTLLASDLADAQAFIAAAEAQASAPSGDGAGTAGEEASGSAADASDPTEAEPESADTYDKRKRFLFAYLAEHDIDNEHRHLLIREATGGRKESSAQLAGPELDEVKKLVDQIADGTHEIFLDSNNTYVYRRAIGRGRRQPAKAAS